MSARERRTRRGAAPKGAPAGGRPVAGAGSSAPRATRDAAGAGGPAPRTSSRRLGRPWMMAAIALVALTAVVLLVRRPFAPRRAASAASALSPAARLDAQGAYLEGARLYEAKRNLEALPYFRRVGALLPQPTRQYHLLMTDVLEHAALQPRWDAPQSATRSSVERVAMLHEALAHLDVAERLSRTPREIAEVRAWRANLLRVWGFPWEALASLRAAVAADSSWTVVAGSADLFTFRVHHPDRSIPGIDTDAILRDAP